MTGPAATRLQGFDAGTQAGELFERLGQCLFQHLDADTDGDSDVGSAPVGGTAARVEALELALAEALDQLTALRARVEALEAGDVGPTR